MTDDDLDFLLSAPLEEVGDAGFSVAVAARIERQAWWRERVMLYAPIAAAAAVVPLLPLDEVTDAALRFSTQIANSSAVALAAAAIVLTFAVDRRLREAA